MLLPAYINLHTHKATGPSPANTLEIVNRHDHFEEAIQEPFYSMGIHPWYMDHAGRKLAQLKAYSVTDRVLAIGECGLDKVCRTDWQLQLDLFTEQIQWANTLGKPLIIHCVRAYSEALHLLQSAQVPVIFHGFNKKQALASEIISKGHHLSFGAALCGQNAVLRETFAAMPADRIFLETDDSDLSIGELYRTAAGIRKSPEDVFILQLQQNYKNVFER